MGEKQFGARWWRESLGIARWATRPAVGTLGLLGALSLSACTTWGEVRDDDAVASAAREDVDVNVDALQLQRDEGWDVGMPGGTLAFTGSTTEDSSGGQGWRTAMAELPATMAPRAPALLPFYVPTLFQSLVGPAGQRLRAVMRPIHTPEMDADFARGVALRAEFAAAGWPKDTAIVVDAPGPRALAVAAALADHFAPVYTFGNWPHPLGVVPAHLTLAAALWYRPMLAAADALRPADAPPLFVLDANRLNPYRDADTEFDNRYFVRLPTAAELAALGIKHVLYVAADGTHELDDLNAAMVALCDHGVDVKMVALGDFVRPDDAQELAQNEEGDDGDALDAVGVDPEWGAAFFFAQPWWLAPRYYYRGCWWDRGLFWGDYGWYAPQRPPSHVRGPIVVGPPTVHRPLPASRAAWHPLPRATIFGQQAARFSTVPTFGQVAVRAARSDGHVLAVQPGNGVFHESPTTFRASQGVFHGGRGVSNGVFHGSNGAFHVGGSGFHGNEAFHVGSSGFHGSNGAFHVGGSGFHGNGAFHAGSFGRSGSIGRAGGFGGG